MLCEYSDIFGRPYEGVHALRIGPFALVDLALTLLASWPLAAYFKIHFLAAFAGLWLLGTFLHALFCVDTGLFQMVRALRCA